MSLLLLLRSGASAQAAAGTVAATSGTAGTATSLLAASGTVAATSSVSGDAGIIVAPQQYPAAATVAVVSGAAGTVELKPAPPAGTFVDDFNRADGPLGANWVTTPNAMTVAGNTVAGGVASSAARWATAAPAGTLVSQVTLTGGSSQGPAVAMPAFTQNQSLASSGTWYAVRSISSNGLLSLGQKNAGAVSYTTLASTAQTQVPGDVLRVEFDGTQVRAYKNGVLVLQNVPATPISGQSNVGMVHTVATEVGVGVMDDWQGGVVTPQQYAAAGTVAAVSTVSGDAAVITPAAQYPAAGTVAATSDTTGAATARLGVPGTVAATTTVTGSATSMLPAAGTVAATTTTTGATTARLPAAGTVAGTSSTTGAAGVRQAASGTVAASTGITGAAAARLGTAGTAPATSTASGTASVIGAPQQLPAVGTVAGTSAVSGTAGVRAAAAGSAASTSTTSGTATLRLRSGGTVAVGSGTSADVTLRLAAAGVVQALATLTGDAELVPRIPDDPNAPTGRILSARVYVLGASGDLSAPTASGQLATRRAAGRIAAPESDGQVRALHIEAALR